jgi:hypothetical protein
MGLLGESALPGSAAGNESTGMPSGVASSLILNVLAFVLALVALSLVTMRRRLARNRRVALALFLTLELALVGVIALLVGLTADPESSRFSVWVLTNLAVSTYGLTTVMAFLIVIVLADLLRGPFVVLLRAVFILWILLQWPLWISTLLTVGAETALQFEFAASPAVVLYVAGLLLSCQGMTIWLVIRHRAKIDLPSLSWAIILSQLGNALLLLFPTLRTPLLLCVLALTVAALIIYAMLRDQAVAV